MVRQYLKIIYNGKENTCLELLDHSQIVIKSDQLHSWSEYSPLMNYLENVDCTEESCNNVVCDQNITYEPPVVFDLPDTEAGDVCTNQDVTKTYIRVLRKSKFNTRIELPDHSKILIPTESLPEWTLVEDTTVQTTEKKYLRIAFCGKKNLRLELIDHTTKQIPIDEIGEWELVSSKCDKNNSNIDLAFTDAPKCVTPLPSDTQGVCYKSAKDEIAHIFKNPLDSIPVVSNEESVSDDIKKKRVSKSNHTGSPRKRNSFRRNSNGLSMDHPYESVNMEYSVTDFEGFDAPF